MELLAPAGNLEKLRYAAEYGADSVYFGMEFGSLRSFAGNFSLEDAFNGLKILHSMGKKGYVTFNIYPFSNEIERIKDLAARLDDIGVDAFIISDMGVLMELKKLRLNAKLHISTQANTTNYQAVMAYNKLGAKRVNLARELSLDRIIEIQKNLYGSVETEVFIHGAVCFSYSGRCAISDYLAGYPANRGECKHPCRWKYFLMEETRPGEYMPVFEDERGLYLFNCKELALFEYIPALKEAGVNSLKIEGRMKSIHYIATVVSFYRQVLDGKVFSIEEGLELLNRVPNRGYSSGFMKGHIEGSDYQFDLSGSASGSVFIGNVKDEKINNSSVLEVRNKVSAGEEVETLSTDGSLSKISMPAPLITSDGSRVKFANHSQSILIDQNLKPYTILRRVGV
ncbi:MAG: U32 family peptidase [Deltaproteobacteria bacterium]|nr:U32 family peptidase [Deltaproteobacteria bacterium]